MPPILTHSLYSHSLLLLALLAQCGSPLCIFFFLPSVLRIGPSGTRESVPGPLVRSSAVQSSSPPPVSSPCAPRPRFSVRPAGISCSAGQIRRRAASRPSSVSADPWPGPAVCVRGVWAGARCAALEALGVGISCRRELCGGQKAAFGRSSSGSEGLVWCAGGGGGLVFPVWGLVGFRVVREQRSLAYLARQAPWWKASHHRRSPRREERRLPKGIPAGPQGSGFPPRREILAVLQVCN